MREHAGLPGDNLSMEGSGARCTLKPLDLARSNVSMQGLLGSRGKPGLGSSLKFELQVSDLAAKGRVTGLSF